MLVLAYDRWTRRFFLAAGTLCLVGGLGGIVAAGPRNAAELRRVLLWFITGRVSWLPVALFSVLVGCLIARAWISRQDRRRFEANRQLGAVPFRHLPSQDTELLRRTAVQRWSIFADVGHAEEIERLSDALLAIPVDFGGSELEILAEDDEKTARVTLVIAMMRLALGQLPGRLFGRIVDRFREVARIRKQSGEGRVVFDASGCSERIGVVVDDVQGRTRLRLQVLSSPEFPLDFSQLGFDSEQLRAWQKWLVARSGLVLLSGPRGHGVTMTLYALAHHLSQSPSGSGIVSLENPIRCPLPFVDQYELGDANVDSALEALLPAADQSVLLLRQVDCATMPWRKCLTAAREKLVVVTLEHTSCASALAAVNTLEAEVATVACAQRLFPRLCMACRSELTAENGQRARLQRMLGDDFHSPLYRGRGCARCRDTGFDGTLTLFELQRRDENGQVSRVGPSLVTAAASAAARGDISVDEVASLFEDYPGA